jgi:hypothetical protein
MKFKYLLLFTLLSNISYSQKNIIIANSISNTPILYANIKVLNSDKGFYSNNKGIFIIDNKLNKNDSILVTCLGYSSIKKQIGKLKDTIFLNPSIENLKEITLKSKKPILKKIGFKRKNMAFFTGTDFQLGLLIQPVKKDENKYINEIIIPVTKGIKHIKRKNKTFNSILKVLLFSVKENHPYKTIIKKPIIINYNNNSRKKIKVDISDENIQFDNNGIFICIEIVGEIDIEGNIINQKNPRPGFVCTDKKTKDFSNYKTYYKQTADNDWKEFRKETFHLEKDMFLAIQLILAKYEG